MNPTLAVGIVIWVVLIAMILIAYATTYMQTEGEKPDGGTIFIQLAGMILYATLVYAAFATVGYLISLAFLTVFS